MVVHVDVDLRGHATQSSAVPVAMAVAVAVAVAVASMSRPHVARHGGPTMVMVVVLAAVHMGMPAKPVLSRPCTRIS